MKVLIYGSGLTGRQVFFRGEFAKYIHRAFPHSKLYLFDTFEGFDQRGVKYEKERSKEA